MFSNDTLPRGAGDGIEGGAFWDIHGNLRDAYVYIKDGELPDIGDGGEGNEPKVKLFTPDSSWTWYLSEYDPKTKRAFGFCLDSGFPDGAELGYVSLEELAEARGRLGLPIERDLYWTPVTFEELQQRARRSA